MVDHAVSGTMDISLEQLEAELLKLPHATREHLRSILEASLDEREWEETWRAEVERRAQAYRNGEIESIPREEALARLRASLRK